MARASRKWLNRNAPHSRSRNPHEDVEIGTSCGYPGIINISLRRRDQDFELEMFYVSLDPAEALDLSQRLAHHARWMTIAKEQREMKVEHVFGCSPDHPCQYCRPKLEEQGFFAPSTMLKD